MRSQPLLGITEHEILPGKYKSIHREPETVLTDLSEWPQQEIIPNMPEIIQYRFYACDQLIDGKVKIYYYVSDTASVWEENIRNAMEDRRLMISLEIRSGDEVEVLPNPYSFFISCCQQTRCQAEYFADSIGCRVDVVLSKMDNKDDRIYLECVWSGNIKAHTSGNGIYQTGVPYKNSSQAKTEPFKDEYVNGSIIEFTGKDPNEIGTMSEYMVDYLIVQHKGEVE